MVQRTRINFSSTLGLFPHTYTHTWTSTDGNVSQLLQYVCSFLREYFGNYRSREERPSRMVLTVTEDTPADMLAGSMELLVQLPREHHHQTQRVTVQRSTPMMDLLVQIATAHKLAASSYTLQAIGERGMVLPHQPNTPIGALDALQVKLLPKQGTFVPRRTKQANQPFETTFRLQQVHLPRNQLYVSRVSPKMNLGEILDEVCREKNLDRNKYELRHPANLEETLDLSLSLQDYHLQEVTLYAKQGRTLGAALSTQDIMALQRQEERRRQQAKQGVFGFVFKKSKEGSLSTDSLGGRSASPARSDETGRSSSPLQPPARPQRKRRPAPKPPVQAQPEVSNSSEENAGDSGKDKVVISHSRNSSDSSGYHEASVLSDNPDTAGRLPETLPRRHRAPTETPRKLAQTSQSSKSLGNLAAVSGTLTRGISSTSLSSTGLRKKRAAPPPPVTRPLSSAISTQALERIVDSEESLTSDMDPSKPPSDIGVPSKANSDIEERPKASSDIGVTTVAAKLSPGIDFAKQETAIVNAEQKAGKLDVEPRHKSGSINVKLPSDEPGNTVPVEDAPVDARVTRKRVGDSIPFPKPRKTSTSSNVSTRPQVPKRKLAPPSPFSRILSTDSSNVDSLSNAPAHTNAGSSTSDAGSDVVNERRASNNSVGSNTRTSTMCNTEIESVEKLDVASNYSNSENEVFLTPGIDQYETSFDYDSTTLNENETLESPKTMIFDEAIKNSTDNKKSSIDDVKENIESSSSQIQTTKLLKNESNPTTPRKVSKQETLCAVISTIPKCAHLDMFTESQPSLNIGKSNKAQEKQNADVKSDIDGATIRNEVWENVKETKRGKILRTASKSNDFETNILEKQKRHLTSHADDITFALNLNVASNVDMVCDRSKESDNNDSGQQSKEKEDTDSEGVGGGKSPRGLGVSDTNLSETDALLQKVSDTLSNTLPVSTSNDVPVEGFASPVETKTETTNISKETDISNTKKSVTEQDLKQQSNDLPDEPVVNTSTPNQTVNSQQDTSDYVSAADEDLSIADWEYQLPAPPSAFRDTASPVFDNFDAVPSSPESFRDPDVKERVEILDKIDSRKSSEKQEAAIEDRNLLERETKKEAIQKSFKQQRSDANLKKEVICELENKIGTLPQGTKDFDSRRSSDSSSTPKVAPIDNTLSNFTITTYTRQKNLNIFEDVKDRSPGKSSDDRFKSFATLSRHKSNNVDETEEPKDFNVGTLQGKKRVNTNEDDVVSDKKLEPKMQTESLHRWQSGNEAKSNIQRSKSYVSVCGKSKFQGNSCEDEDVRNDRNLVEIDNVGMKKATSVTGLNAPTTRSNEKFSQWRDNILKRQEEPTKEKQLQSLQVLKSILPQLKNAQQAEENVPKESDNTVLPEKTRSETTSNEHSIESNAVSTRDCQRATSNTKSEPESKKSPSEASSKRYTYSGPPAINLGSWSERPSVNVQIKMDMDYKLGTNKANNKTIVNINGTRDELDGLNGIEDSTKQQKSFEKNGKFAGKVEIVSSDRREPNELAKKLITHTTASGFKKPVLNKVNSEIKTTSTDKPIVTGVELKKNFQGGKQDDNVIDTSPVNFKELSKAFGQDVCLRPKPKRSTLNRRSDLQMETDSGKQNGYINSEYCTNGTQDSLKPKRFTSIVGIQPQNQGNFVFRNGISAINNQPMPVVKGFKFSNAATDGGQGNQNSTRGSSNESSKDTSTESLNSVPQPPRPPTMPVITGVTLKSARPKSMPVQMDPRDVLLESIRNFGGRENLKSAAERC
ncbi:uncharacterized protein LOC143153525 isoform X4 [Ptiloglossa arizonensis]|uniref:uncharacterized protein LOC143153525 isoform X4 n=1 Tax=Ptiloglossa arizonensis TaxID=3350558 RepID=UPI003F9FDCF3